MSLGKRIFNVVVLVVLLVIAIPAALVGGWFIAGILAALWLLGTLGGRYYLNLYKQQHMGSRGRGTDPRDLIAGDGDDRRRDK